MRRQEPELTPPPPHRPAVTLRPGDLAVYPARGLGKVLGIEHKQIHDRPYAFYVVHFMDSDLRILIPVEKAEQVGLRPVASNDQVEDVLALLREPDDASDTQAWNRRYRGLLDKLRSGSLYELAEVLRDLHRLRRRKTLSFGERRMLDTALALLAKELSAARRSTVDAAKQELLAALGSRPVPPQVLVPSGT